jgi:Tol biopolymer transport system component/DNA-binding winged helix-turn-helix (wHTH) protein
LAPEVAWRNFHAAMNQMSPLPIRPIELAIEAPFRLRTLEVTPAALEFRRGDQRTTLEPRVMQVLVALHRARNTVVSREELLEMCWEGRIVGDDSLNRSVSQLRKVLADEEAVSVDTIPRVGYRLRLESESEIAPLPLAGQPKRGRSRRIKIGAAAGLLAIGGAIGATMLFATAPRSWSASGVRPLTQEPGVEMFPAISPDGLAVAYTAGAGFWAPRDIYLRNLSVGDATPVRITDTPHADETVPAWSPSGNRLAFLREKTGGACTVVMITPPNGSERIVSKCTDPYAGLTWLNPQELIIGNRPPGARARHLIAVDVISGRSRRLTNPPANMLGDSAPSVSSDGSMIAFRRTAAMGSDAVYLLDTHTGKTRPLTDDGWKAAGFSWANDGRTLFFTSNRGGDFGLWSIDTARGSKPRRITLGMLPLGRLSTDRQSRQIVVETGRTQANLALVGPNGGSKSPITIGEGTDWDPDVRTDGTILFASDRSGTNQIWIRRPNGRIVRLTDMNASYVYAPRWSPDGQKIAFLAVVGGRTDIYSIRPDGSRLEAITNDGTPKGRAAWAEGHGDLFFTAVDGSGWRLMRHDLRVGRSSPVPGSAGIAIIERGGARLFGRRTTEDPIVEIDPQSGALRALPARIAVSSLEAWTPRHDGIVHIRGQGPSAQLWLMSWNGAHRFLAPLRQAPRTPFATTADGSIVTPQLVSDDRDLMLIDLE